MLYFFKFKFPIVFCPSCGAENKDSAKFCTNCGAPLPIKSSSVKNTEENKGRLKKYKSSKSSDKTPSKASTNSGFKRAKKDKVIFGICKGLENSGRGSANLWRGILVAVSLFLTGIPVIIYIIAGLVIPISDE